MNADAFAAAKAIIDNRKAEGSGCWQQTRTAFKCAPGTGFLFVLVALTEIYTNTFIVLFDFVPNRTYVYMSMVLTVMPRLIIFVWASWRINKKNWWRYWLTIDNVLMLTVVISIVYGYMLLKVPEKDRGETGAFEWRIGAVVSLPLLMGAFNGNFRILVKMYPWTPVTIVVYKCLRIYAVVLGTAAELMLRAKAVPGLDPGLMILYVSSQASYHVSLLAKIPSWTAWQRAMEAKALAAQASGVPLTLDRGAYEPQARATAMLVAGYASYDEENEQSVQFHRAQHAALSIQVGTNDDLSLPVDISAIKTLHAESPVPLDSDYEPEDKDHDDLV